MKELRMAKLANAISGETFLLRENVHLISAKHMLINVIDVRLQLLATSTKLQLPPGVTYELVKAGPSSGFLHRKQGFMYHCNFKAKRTNSSDDSDTMMFFGELMQSYPKDPCVTNCCILGSVDDVCSGNNGCRACTSGVHHPSEGFYIGGLSAHLL